jgi:hypothetical protein
MSLLEKASKILFPTGAKPPLFLHTGAPFGTPVNPLFAPLFSKVDFSKVDFQKGDNYLMYKNTYKSIYSNNYNAK